MDRQLKPVSVKPVSAETGLTTLCKTGSLPAKPVSRCFTKPVPPVWMHLFIDRSNPQPQGVPEILDWLVRLSVPGRFGWHQKHKIGRIPSHKASQKFSISSFDSALEGGSDGIKNTTPVEYRATRHPRNSRLAHSTQHWKAVRMASKTQNRSNTEPQGIPEILD